MTAAGLPAVGRAAALVTGAGRGLGRRYALDLAAAGYTVAVHARAGERAAAVVSEIDAAGGRAVPVTGDARDGRRLVETAVAALGRLDVLVVNAGGVRDRGFSRMTDDDWDEVVDVHLRGSYTACSAAWPHLREQGGAIVLTTSGAALHGNPGQAAYAAAKAGVIGLARTLAREGARHRIRVNAVAPMALTDMTEHVFADRPEHRLLRAEDVAPVVVALAHPACPVNGHVIETGGAWAAAVRWERSHGARFAGSDGLPPDPVEILRQWDVITDFSALPTDHPVSVADSLGAATGSPRPFAAGTDSGTERCS